MFILNDPPINTILFQANSTKSNQICLIDTGDIIDMDTIQNKQMFLLPDDIKSIPAQAICCKIAKVCEPNEK